MSSTFLTIPRALQSAHGIPQPQASRPRGYGGHACVGNREDGNYAVYDASADGNRAYHHGWLVDRAEAVAEGRAVAGRIGAASFSDYSKGGAA